MRRQRWCENIVSTGGSCTCMASLPLELAPSRIRAHPIGRFFSRHCCRRHRPWSSPEFDKKIETIDGKTEHNFAFGKRQTTRRN
jgi:hypothetical protein